MDSFIKSIGVWFKKPTYYKGRNGIGILNGIELTKFKNSKDIELTIINSKGHSEAVKIVVPLEEIEQLIYRLKFIKKW